MKLYAITRKTRMTRKNPYPYTWITRTLRTGTGFCGYGYGLPWDTPGLPVIIPSRVWTRQGGGEHVWIRRNVVEVVEMVVEARWWDRRRCLEINKN
jgi:hypothetical protein